MKTLHVFQSVDPAGGGPIEAVRQLVRWYEKKKHEFDSASFDVSIEIASLDCPSSLKLHFPGCAVYPLRRHWLDQLVPLSLIGWMQRHAGNYDVVVVHGIWGPHLAATWWALRRSSLPYAVYMHGMLDPWFKRRYPLKHLKKWLVWPWAIHPGLRDAQAVFFTCDQERILARQSFWLYQPRERILPYGTEGIPDPSTDYATTFLDQHPALQQRRCLLFLGRVHPKKGPDLLIRALAVLQRDGLWRSQDHCLVMAGPCHGRYALALTRLAERLGVANSIHWTGMLLGNAKWGAFQAAEAFVLPSHQENYGIAVAEALSASTPVLITHPVNISPEIAADHAGLVEADTLPGIAGLLRQWLALDAQALETMGRNARHCYQHRYSVETFGKAFQQMAAELVQTI